MYKGQRVKLEDERGRFLPFKGVVTDSGIRALEEIHYKKSGDQAADAGYILYKGTAPDKIKQECKDHGWICKPLMEENE